MNLYKKRTIKMANPHNPPLHTPLIKIHARARFRTWSAGSKVERQDTIAIELCGKY